MMFGHTKYAEVVEYLEVLKKSDGSEERLEVLSQASQLKEEEYVPILAQILKEDNSKLYHKACYDLLSCFYRNTANRQCRELLCDGLLQEEDAALLCSILDSLDSIPNAEIFQRVCELVSHSNQRVRMSAIYVLKYSENAEAELFLLGILNGCRNSDELSLIVVVLGELGTSLSLPALITGLKSRSGNVWERSIWAISRISKRYGYNSTKLLVKCLKQTKSNVRMARILNSLCFAGDESALELVKETLVAIISSDEQQDKIRGCLNFGGVTDYLLRYAGREVAESFLKSVVERYGNLHERIPECQLDAFRKRMHIPD